MVFHGFWLVSMVFKVVSWFFMVFGWFPWFFKVVSWFFMVFGWFPWFCWLRTSQNCILAQRSSLGLTGRRPALAQYNQILFLASQIIFNLFSAVVDISRSRSFFLECSEKAVFTNLVYWNILGQPTCCQAPSDPDPHLKRQDNCCAIMQLISDWKTI